MNREDGSSLSYLIETRFQTRIVELLIINAAVSESMFRLISVIYFDQELIHIFAHLIVLVLLIGTTVFKKPKAAIISNRIWIWHNCSSNN